MKLNNILFIIISILLISSFTGATTVGEEDDEIKAIGNIVLDNVLYGINKKDYEIYSKDFDLELIEAIPEEKFKIIVKQMNNFIGNHKKRTFLGFINKKNVTIILWKAKYDKTTEDILIRLVISKEEDKYLIKGILFQ